MVNLKNKDIKETLLNLGLDEKSITTFCKYINEKDWFEAIKIYKKLEITRKNLDSKDKIYVLLKVDNKGYDVNLEIDKDKLIHFCNCSHREDDNGCEHAGAVLLYKMLQKEKNDLLYTLEPFFVTKKRKSGISKMNLVEMGINSLWVFDCNRRCFYEYADDLNLEIVRSIIKNPKKLELNEEELKDFFSKYYQKILNNFDFNISDDLQRKSKCVIPKATLYLERLDNKIKIKLKFDYASREVNYFCNGKNPSNQPKRNSNNGRGKII